MTARVWCEWAWLGGDDVEAGVLIEIDGEQIASVQRGASSCPAGAMRRVGVTLPGFENRHSHVFHRALRGRTQRGGGSFWTWRQQMYELAARLDPDSMHALARATFAEMALAGISTVCEFHYLHHDAGGHRYADPNAMGAALVDAASAAGVRLVLIDACYLRGGFDTPLEEVQLRFGDGSADAWAGRVEALAAVVPVPVGAAIHSVRALTPSEMEAVAAWARAHGAPLHAHVSEQPAENEACLVAHGVTPTHLLDEAGAFEADFTAVHAVHVSDADVALLGRATVCLCPTTERDLADGIAPSASLRDAGARLAVGSDSHAVIDLLEETRAIELDTRLAGGERGGHGVAELLGAVTGAGVIAAGAPADLVTVGLDSVRMAGTADHLASIVFAATAADVTHVMVAGRAIVEDGVHVSIDVGRELDTSIRSAWGET